MRIQLLGSCLVKYTPSQSMTRTEMDSVSSKARTVLIRFVCPIQTLTLIIEKVVRIAMDLQLFTIRALRISAPTN